MTFRKQAQAQLKSFREQGYELTCKLNASNEVLLAELRRIDELLKEEIENIKSQLETPEEALVYPSCYLWADESTEIEEGVEFASSPLPKANRKAIAVAAKVTARAVHEVKEFDYALVGAKVLLVTLVVLLYTIKGIKWLHKAHTAASSSRMAVTTRAIVKACTAAFWDSLRPRYSLISREYKVPALEFIFCLG